MQGIQLTQNAENYIGDMEIQPAEFTYAKLSAHKIDHCLAIREYRNASVEEKEMDNTDRFIKEDASKNFYSSQNERPTNREFIFENQENISFVGNKDSIQSKTVNNQNIEVVVAQKWFGDLKHAVPHLNESFWKEVQGQYQTHTSSEMKPLNNKKYNEINKNQLLCNNITRESDKRVIVQSQNNFKPQSSNTIERIKSTSEIIPFRDDIFPKDSLSYKNIIDSRITKIKSRQKYLYNKTKSLVREAQMLQTFLIHNNIKSEVVSLLEHSNEVIKMRQNEEEDEVIDICDTSFTSSDTNENYQQTMQNFISQIESSQAAQEAILFRQRCPNRYFGGGSSQCTLSTIKAANTKFIPKLGKRLMNNIKNFNKQTKSQLRIIEKEFDSDATESSSGGESFDDSSNYKNDINKGMTIIKRAAYEWLRDKCSIIAKREWLESKIHDNEMQLKKLEDAQKRIRLSKSTFRFEGDICTNGNVDVAVVGCARTRPLVTKLFRKRKLLQMSNLHTASTIAARPSTVRCGCQWPMQPCSICTGREDPIAPRPPNDRMSLHEKLALLDPGVHSKLSLLTEIHQNFHFEAIMKMNEWQTKMKRHGPRLSRMISKNEKYREQQKKYNYCSTEPKPGLKKRGRKPNALKNAEIGSNRNAIPLNTGEIENYVSANSSKMNETYKSLTSAEAKENHPSYDPHYKKNAAANNTDNIFVPQNVVATTRVEVLQYKEIVTPKWRILDISANKSDSNIPEVIEDLSEDNAIKRHDRAYCEERKKFGLSAKFMWTTRSRANKRLYIAEDNIKYSDSDPNSLDESECSNNNDDDDALQPKGKPMLRQISLSPTNMKDYLKYDFWPQAPYNKRSFPINDDEYDDMIELMPAGHILHLSQTSSEEKSYSAHDYNGDVMETEEIQFRTSYISDTDYSETDDPNDPEWN